MKLFNMKNTIFLLAIICLPFYSFSPSTSTSVNVKNYQELITKLDEYHFDLNEVRKTKTLPNLRIINIDASIKKLSTKDKKRAFISAILLAITSVNQDILYNRKKITSIINIDKKDRTAEQNAYIQKMKDETKLYKATKEDAMWYYDVVPPSLVIAQAILESAWGTSRFAIEGNSLFGEHMPKSAKGKYIQAKGSDIRLRAFPTIEDAVRGYIYNLNRNNAYKSLRDERLVIRKEIKGKEHFNSDEHGKRLANTQDHYSEIGHEYTKRIITVIEQNHLKDFDYCKFKTENQINITINQ